MGAISTLVIVLLAQAVTRLNGDGPLANGGYQMLSNETGFEMVLNKSDYCHVNNNTIRIHSTEQNLSIIDRNEDTLRATTNASDDGNIVVYIVPANGSPCTSKDKKDKKLSTELFLLDIVALFATILFAIGNISLHMLVKDMRSVAGMLIMLLCVIVTITTLVSIGHIINSYTSDIILLCAILTQCLFALLFAYQATKLAVLFNFAFLMYKSYRQTSDECKNIKKRLLKYVMFILASSAACYCTVIVTEVATNSTVITGKKRYCLHSKYALKVLYAELCVYIILEHVVFAIGLRLYFLVTKNCRASKAANLRIALVLISMVGINIVLLVILNVAGVPEHTDVPAVIITTLVEQMLVLMLSMSSSKVRAKLRDAWLGEAYGRIRKISCKVECGIPQK